MKKPTLSTVTINGTTRHRVTYWTHSGRQRQHFKSIGDAESRIDAIQRDQKDYGERAAAMTAEQRADAVEALRILKPTGRTLVEAARRMIEALAGAEGVPVREAVNRFLAKRGNVSTAYLATLTPRLNKFAEFVAGKSSSAITADDCERFLDAVARTSGRQTVRHYWTHLRAFFTFCKTKKLAASNPIDEIDRPKVIPVEVGLLTPAQTKALLDACPPAMIPGMVFQAFCGIRVAEAERIDWRHVNLDDRKLTIGADIAKTNSKRVVPIPENAIAWLADHAQDSGPVWPKKIATRKTLEKVRAAAGFAGKNTWPQNALRHSCISYRVAIEGDLATIAYESGNSPKVIQEHYNGLARERDAKAYFDVRP